MVLLQDGSEGCSPKREQSAAIDIPAPRNEGSTYDPLRTRSGTQDSTPTGTYRDIQSKPDEGTPPRPLPVDEPIMFERRYSEPVDVIGAGAVVRDGAEQPESGGGEVRGRKQRITWSKSAHQLVTSSLPDSTPVAIQIEVGGFSFLNGLHSMCTAIRLQWLMYYFMAYFIVRS